MRILMLAARDSMALCANPVASIGGSSGVLEVLVRVVPSTGSSGSNTRSRGPSTSGGGLFYKHLY